MPDTMVLITCQMPWSLLQARYHGPYLIEKQISNLNYIIHTPQATTTLSYKYVKPYFDKDSVSSHSVNIMYSVPFESIDCKI